MVRRTQELREQLPRKAAAGRAMMSLARDDVPKADRGTSDVHWNEDDEGAINHTVKPRFVRLTVHRCRD